MGNDPIAVLMHTKREHLDPGERKLRAHLPPLTALSLQLTFRGKWMVATKIWPAEGYYSTLPGIVLPDEPLEGFPSEALIAQCMLVA